MTQEKIDTPIRNLDQLANLLSTLGEGGVYYLTIGNQSFYIEKMENSSPHPLDIRVKSEMPDTHSFKPACWNI